MEELYELRTYIATGKYQEALLLLDEMEEMSRDDKINRISIFYASALDSAALEALGGRYTSEEISAMIDRSEIIGGALQQMQPVESPN